LNDKIKKIEVGRSIHEGSEKYIQNIGQKIGEEPVGSIGAP
jgi:predicted NAD/FAD-binding protein